MIELGGNIVLEGFQEEDGSTLIIIKKMVGQYARKISNMRADFQRLTLRMKYVRDVHGDESGTKYELAAHLLADEDYISEVTDRNIFFALDKALSQIVRQISS